MGTVHAGAQIIELGDRVEAEVLVVSNDPELTYEWFSDMGGTFDEPADGPKVYWNAPEDTEENRNTLLGEFPTVMVTVTDSLGKQTSGFVNLLLSQDVTTTYSSVVGGTAGRQNTGESCSVSSSGDDQPGGALAVLLLGLLGLVRRRWGPHRR